MKGVTMTLVTVQSTYVPPTKLIRSLGEWEGSNIALRVDEVSTDDEGNAKSVTVSVASEGEVTTGVKVTQQRLLNQIAGMEVSIGDIVAGAIVAYGRGHVFAPLPEDVKAEDLAEPFTAEPEAEPEAEPKTSPKK